MRRGLGVLLSCWLAAIPCAADERIGLCISDTLQQQLHAEMRQLLGATHGVHAALAARDMDALTERALAAGSAMEGQIEKHAADHHAGLPHEFVKLGRATHAAFDDLAAAGRDSSRPRDLLPVLAKVSAQCVACHDKYRIAPMADCAAEGEIAK